MSTNTYSILLALALVGCTPKGDDDPIEGGGTLRGHAESPASHDRSARVGAWRLGADGSTTAASDEVETDASGAYTLTVDVSAGAESNLIVQAIFDDGTTAEVLVTEELAEDGEVTVAPTSEESSAEAGAYTSLTVSGEWDAETMTTGMLRAVVDAEVGAAWADINAADRDATAGVIGAATAALTLSARDADTASAASAEDLLAWLYIGADAEADAAFETVGSTESSLDLRTALDAAYAESGYSNADLAIFVHAGAEAASAEAEASGSAASEGEGIEAVLDLLTEARVTLLTEVVSAASTAVGTDASEEAASAGLVLGVDALVDGDADGAASLDAALDVEWSAYADEVLLGVTLALDLDAQAALLASVEMTALAQAQLSAALDGAQGDADAIGAVTADAMAEYRATVEAGVSAELEASAVLSDAEVNAVTTILVQLYAGSR